MELKGSERAGGIFIIARARAYIVEYAPACRQAGTRMLIIGLISLFVSPLALAATKKAASPVELISSAKLDECLPAIETLSFGKKREVVPALTRALASETRPLVRRYLVDALGRMGDQRAVPALKDALRDADVQVRQSAVVALSGYGSAAIQKALIDLTKAESDPAVKTYISQAMGRSRHPESALRLEELAEDSNGEIRRMAREELNRKKGAHKTP